MKNVKDIFLKIHYELVRVIAEGGMGTVYEARQIGIDGFSKTVAIKLIKEEYSKIPEFCNNFIGEAKLVADLIHTNIVQTYHLGFTEGKYFIVMEYVNGITLEDFIIRHLQTKQEIPVELAVFIVSRLCRGLAYAHQKTNSKRKLLNIVHRDVNPKNLLITLEGDVKLTDFGIAKARKLMYNREGEMIAGKDEYLSPEQARKEVTDPRADIFSCGVILSEMISGINVFEGSTAQETRHNIQHFLPPDFQLLRTEVTPPLNYILHKALQKNRAERYQSALEMLFALEKYMYTHKYGPTSEKLAYYMYELFSPHNENAALNWARICS